MNISTRVFKSLTGRRRKSIDPAKHFAVRIQNGYANPVTREQFFAAVQRVGGKASLLKRIAAAGMREARDPCAAGPGDGHLAEAIGMKLADAEKLQSDFETFVRQLIFSDQNAFGVVEQARHGIAEAIDAMHRTLVVIDRRRQGQIPTMLR